MATWHCTNLRHGLFPLLGEAFIRRWHATFIELPRGVALVAELERPSGPVRAGFLIGSTDQVGLVDAVLQQYRFELARAGVAALLLRPKVLAHFVRTRARAYLTRMLRGARRTRPQLDAATAAAGRDRVAVLTALVVDPVARGTGVGSALVAEFLRRAQAAGSPEARLTTRTGETGAGPFYAANGWTALGTHETRDGADVTTYMVTLARHDR